jgi:hypothetical protein
VVDLPAQTLNDTVLRLQSQTEHRPQRRWLDPISLIFYIKTDFCTQKPSLSLYSQALEDFANFLAVLQGDAISVTVNGALPFSTMCTDASPIYT